MYALIYSDAALKQLKKLDKPIQERILSAIERIQVRPESFISKLVGRDACKFRVGDYRIILDIMQDRMLILVIEIGHRKNIYN
ncbi:MAG TPA: type II toxin-antitoxin system RelE/ParE family toxin [Candidatus Nanoarchaeia archaeon]|nr:type II toxin-antitoxin system RelE/ParE family toxin [Candidatus Nanoarchaeia archaeon]